MSDTLPRNGITGLNGPLRDRFANDLSCSVICLCQALEIMDSLRYTGDGLRLVLLTCIYLQPYPTLKKKKLYLIQFTVYIDPTLCHL